MNIHIPWPILGLALLVAAVATAAILELGAPTSSARTATELVTAQNGVVQSTVTGTGNVEPATDVSVSFQTAGVLQGIDVKLGQHVDKGQLLATLDPTAAQLTVDQAQQSLTAAEDQLANAESQQSSASSSSSSSTTSSASSPSTTGASGRTGSSPASGSSRATGSSSAIRSSGAAGSAGATDSAGATGSAGAGTQSAYTLAASVASAQAAVDGAQASLRTAENSLSETRLFAPASGTVVSVASVSPGQAVPGSGSGASASGAGSGRGSGSSNGSGSGAGTAATGSSSSSSSGLVEIASTRSLTMTVSFSESDIDKIHVGQPATVTLDALSGVELPAKVTSISPIGTASGGVVSYDATLSLQGYDPRVKAGMSASAAVITAQASGVNLPSSAVPGTGGSVARVEVMQNGHEVSTPVVVGLVGDTRTQIVSGLHAGQQVVVTETLPSLSSAAASSGSTLGGGGGLAGGGLGGRFGGGLRRLLGGARAGG